MSGTRGFTLAEMLVALVVAALMSIAAHRALHVLGELAELDAARAEKVGRGAAVREQILGWIRAVPASDGWGIRGWKGAGATAPADVVEFRTRSADPFRAEDARVRIELDPISGSIVATVAVAGAPAERLMLVPRAQGLRLRYLYDAGGEQRWADDWVPAATLPRAVELRFLGDSVPPLLRLPLLATVGGAG